MFPPSRAARCVPPTRPARSRMAPRAPVLSAIVMLALVGAGAGAMAAEGAAQGNLCIENRSIAEMQQALSEDRTVRAAARWLETLGLRPIVTRDDRAVLELRGGTHVALRHGEEPPKPGAVTTPSSVPRLTV